MFRVLKIARAGYMNLNQVEPLKTSVYYSLYVLLMMLAMVSMVTP